MAWKWGGTRKLAPQQALDAIDRGLTKLELELTTPEPLYTLPNPAIGASVTPDMGKGSVRTFFWAVTHGGAWSIANPLGLQAGAIVVLTWWNNTVGGILAPTLGTSFGFAPNVPALPTPGSSASMTFVALTPTLLYQVACEPVTGGTGSGETNTGSNQNAAGVGVFDAKVGVDLQFRGIDVPSGQLQIALNAINKTLEMAIAPLGVDKPSIAANAVDFTKFRTMTSDCLVGRDTAGLGNAEIITPAGGVEMDGAGNLRTGAFTGDVTKAAGGTALTIAAAAVTYAKMQNVSATDKVLGRQTAGAGVVEEIACTAAGRALLAGANAPAQRSTLGLLEGQVAADQATFVNVQTNIANMLFSILANEVWIVDWVISVTMGTAATGVKFYFTFPASCTGEIHYEGNVATLPTWQSLYQAVLTVPGTFFVTGIITGMVRLRTTIRNAGTGGTIQLVGITGGATTTCAVKKGSSFIARRQGT